MEVGSSRFLSIQEKMSQLNGTLLLKSSSLSSFPQVRKLATVFSSLLFPPPLSSFRGCFLSLAHFPFPLPSPPGKIQYRAQKMAGGRGWEAPSPLLGWQSFVVVFGTFLLLFLGERVRRSGCDFGKNKLRLRCKEGWRGRDKSWPSLPSSPLLPGSLIPYTILFLPYPSLHGMGFAKVEVFYK